MQLDKAIQSRKSIRKYKSKIPNWRNIIEAIDSAKYAPMAGGIFSLRFILVNDQEKINDMAKWSEQQFITQAKYIVVFVTTPGKTLNSYEKKQGEIFCRQQAGAAIQNFLLKIQEAKLSTCWIGYFNEKEIKRILKIPDNENVEAFFPIGYANEKPKSKNIRDLNEYLYFNQWKNKRMAKIEKVEGRHPEGYGHKIAEDL